MYVNADSDQMIGRATYPSQAWWSNDDVTSNAYGLVWVTSPVFTGDCSETYGQWSGEQVPGTYFVRTIRALIWEMFSFKQIKSYGPDKQKVNGRTHVQSTPYHNKLMTGV
jgi:hypothetical protein